MTQAFNETQYFRDCDLSLFNEMSILPSLNVKLKIIDSVKDRLIKRFGEITKEWVMAELRVLAKFHNKKFIFTHTDKGMLLGKVNALRESLGLGGLKALDKKDLRSYVRDGGDKVYSYFDFDAYNSIRNNTLHI